MRRRLISRSVLSCRTLLTDRHKRSPGAVSFASTHRKRVDGSAAEVPIWSGAGLILINDWSGDGQYLLLTLLIPATPALECGCSRTSRALDDARSRAVRHGRQRHRSRPVRPVTRAAARDHHRRGSGAGNAWDEARSVADRKRECPSATVAQGRAGALLPRRWLPAGCRTSGIDHGLQVWTAAPPLPLPFGFQIAGGQWAPECLRQGALSFASPCDAGAHRAESEQCKCARLGNSLRFRIEEIIHRHNVHSTSRIVIRPER
jgi:hypothetical protein